jgi:hypothetical protein
MLVQNFKTATELKISSAERKALIKVLGMLERGELVDVPHDTHRLSIKPTVPNGFNMECVYLETKCGTVACIGGWVAHLMKHPDPWNYIDLEDNRSEPLYRLYWKFSNNTGVAEAAVAVRNFLTFGDPKWDEIASG